MKFLILLVSLFLSVSSYASVALTKEEFKHVQLNKISSSFDMLLAVTRVGRDDLSYLNYGQIVLLSKEAILFKLDREEQALEKWKNFVVGLKRHQGIFVNLNTIIEWIIKKSLFENNLSLLFHAGRVRYFNDFGKNLFLEVKSQKKILNDCVRVRCGVSTENDIRDFLLVLYDRIDNTNSDIQNAGKDLKNAMKGQDNTFQRMMDYSENMFRIASGIVSRDF